MILLALTVQLQPHLQIAAIIQDSFLNALSLVSRAVCDLSVYPILFIQLYLAFLNLLERSFSYQGEGFFSKLVMQSKFSNFL